MSFHEHHHDHHEHHHHDCGCSCTGCREHHEQVSCGHAHEGHADHCCDCGGDDGGGGADPDSHHHIHHCDCAEHGHDHHDCGCGHEHHEHESHHDCGCGCGCGHDHEHAAEAPFSKQLAWIGAIFIVISVFLPNKSAAPPLMALGTAAVGYPLFLNGIKSLLKLQFEELGLLTVAVAASFGLAAVSSDPLEAIFEAMAVTALFRLGNLLEARAVAKSRRDIESLVNIRPDTALLLLPDGSKQTVPAETVTIGSLIQLKAGDRIPIDCEVVEGTGYADLSAITGEPLPVFAEKGSVLPSGAINSDGLLICRTVSSFEDSAASRIIKLVRQSEEAKGSTERLISKFAAVYTPIVMLMAAALAILPPVLGFGGFKLWLSRALVFLVASCPCALVISVPLTFFAGIGLCSRFGVLVKGARCIEQLAKVNCICFDKTGTVTQGKPTVDEMILLPDSLPRQRLLALAAAAERNSSHPAAKAIVDFAGEVPEIEISELHEISGMGVSLIADGQKVLCGSARLMTQNGIDCGSADGVYLAIDGILQCRFTLTDLPRPEAAEAISKLKQIGVGKVAMLTGDNETAAQNTAQSVGITEVFARLLPEQKQFKLNELKSVNGCTLFVGDGINDAPVLAAADIGAAMGLGTDAAIEAADIVLVGEKLTALPKAVTTARKVVRKANQNIVFALAVKITVLLLGAFGLAAMWMAVFADVGVTLIAVLNSLTLLKDR